MNHKLAIYSLFITLSVSGCGVGEREITVVNCGEPIEISDCKWKGQLFTCLIKNPTNATYAGVPLWQYDKDGNLFEKAPYRYAAGLQPGKTIRQKLPVAKYGDTSTTKIIFCRHDPMQAR